MNPLPIFMPGDILIDGRGWKRKIRSVKEDSRGYQYTYYNEELDDFYHPTGNFNWLSIGACSERHLTRKGFAFLDRETPYEKVS